VIKTNKIIVCFFLVFLLSTVSVSNANGGWYKTKWGMTIEQIRAVITEDIKQNKESSYSIPDFKIGDFSFKIQLEFDDNNGLNKVMAVLKQGQDNNKCFLDLEDELKKKYGAPTNVENKDTPRFSASHKMREWITEDTILTLIHIVLGFGGKVHQETNIIYKARQSVTSDRL
jgi:hypothetical protein